MAKRLYTILPIMLMLIIVAACKQRNDTPVPDPARAVYFWRTTLKMDSSERAFLREHHIKKLYTRFFDVVMRDGEPMPNATLRFLDTVPADVEIIPVICIMENCLKSNMDK